MAFRIGIITGHGDGDPGASGCGYKEYQVVRKLAPYVKKHLSPYADVEILDTSKNWYKYLKSHKYNFSRFNYIIELHVNAGVHDPKGNGHTTGVEIWVTPREKGISVEQKICKELESLGFRNRGVKREDFYVINVIKNQGISACLIENGFIGDKDDMDLLHRDMDLYASKIAKGVVNGFGLKKGSSKPSEPTKPSVSYYKKYTGNSGSIVDALKSIGVNSSFGNRKKIAKVNGIHDYKGTSSQNEKLLSLLKQGKLKK